MLPEALRIGSFSLSGYQLFFILGIVFACMVIFILSRLEKIDSIEIVNYMVFGIVSGIAGAKLYSLTFAFFNNPGFYLKGPTRIFKAITGGGTFYGGIGAMVLFAVFYTRKYFRGSELRVFDISMVGGALGHVFGRIGCLCAGCCYGVPTQLPWGMKFPFHEGSSQLFSDTFVHPTQLYEATLNLANFLILLAFWRKKRFHGQVLSIYLINYGIIRFALEFLRNDGGRGYVMEGPSKLSSLSIPQLVSMILIIAGFILFKKLKVKTKENIRIRSQN